MLQAQQHLTNAQRTQYHADALGQHSNVRTVCSENIRRHSTPGRKAPGPGGHEEQGTLPQVHGR